MIVEEMSDKQLLKTIFKHETNLSNAYKMYHMVNGDMAQYALDGEINMFENELDYLYDELKKRKKKPKGSQLLIDAWKEKEERQCQTI